MPAVYNLAHEGALPERFNLIAISRSDIPHDDYRQMARGVDRAALAPAARRAGARQAARAGALRAGHVRRRLDLRAPPRRAARVRRGGGHPVQPRLLPLDRARRSSRSSSRSSASTGSNAATGAEVRVVIEKPFGTRLARGARAEPRGAVGARRVPGLPHRPLPGQGDGAEHAGVPLRQRHVRADLEPQLHRLRPDHRGRGPRDRLRAPATTTSRARCATWSRTTCCSCSRCSAWSRR